nr:MAG TPA: hypothetical protein [Caudoviricetes sp.]
MFISKKRFDVAIKEAKEAVYMEMQKQEFNREKERETSARLMEMENRMGRAFSDIDKRLSALEQKKQGADVLPWCPKY